MHADPPRHVIVLGATGRTGAPFVTQALTRGHTITAVIRDASRLPASVDAITAALDDTAAFAHAFERPVDAVVAMLSSESNPFTAVSTGTRSVLDALRARGGRSVPFITIASWGLGPSRAAITHPFARLLIGIARRTFWAKPYADFERQLAMFAEARASDLVRPVVILPPILTEGPPTETYRSGDVAAMTDVMSVLARVHRGSIADLAVNLVERATRGEAVPPWVAIRER